MRSLQGLLARDGAGCGSVGDVTGAWLVPVTEDGPRTAELEREREGESGGWIPIFEYLLLLSHFSHV